MPPRDPLARSAAPTHNTHLLDQRPTGHGMLAARRLRAAASPTGKGTPCNVRAAARPRLPVISIAQCALHPSARPRPLGTARRRGSGLLLRPHQDLARRPTLPVLPALDLPDRLRATDRPQGRPRASDRPQGHLPASDRLQGRPQALDRPQDHLLALVRPRLTRPPSRRALDRPRRISARLLSRRALGRRRPRRLLLGRRMSLRALEGRRPRRISARRQELPEALVRRQGRPEALARRLPRPRPAEAIPRPPRAAALGLLRPSRAPAKARIRMGRPISGLLRWRPSRRPLLQASPTRRPLEQAETRRLAGLSRASS
jgi:hypothetical protein